MNAARDASAGARARTPFAPGQRWFSSAEPELGLGTVLRVEGRGVQLVYTGSGVVRQYAVDSAPLLRAAFRPGDRIRVDGRELSVDAVEDADGMAVYLCGTRRVAEGELDAEQPVSQADQRLLAGRVDASAAFELRRETLERRALARGNPAWGLLGARIDLIAHQLRVAEIADERRPPRLLLADEVGLGKTIEAGMILARQLASGRATRALVLVPDSLVHQWYVELRRRFNLAFAIYDEERCEAILANAPDANPFEDEQTLIASTAWLAGDAKRAQQARDAGWDLLVVDEAHHLAWSPQAPSAEYALVDALAHATPGVILLTATPEQLGLEGHYARLKLLDPARYADYDRFVAETQDYRALSTLADRLLSGASLADADAASLRTALGADAPLVDVHLAQRDDATRGRLLDALIDRHGTGRVMLRNRRASVGGFPRRVKHLTTLSPGDDALAGRLHAEFLADIDPRHAEPEHDYARDPRMDWLLDLLERIAPAKLLLICRSRAKVQALEEALRLRSGLAVARFHEDMNLLQRDRNAAFFAQPEGARLLLASEIGAEGRNFQFAQHVALWDLPLDPDQLEQRIGRLDRIGQRGDVNIHVAAVAGTPQALLAEWYDRGLDAFETLAVDGRELLRRFGAELVDVAAGAYDDEERRIALDDLVARTAAAHAELSEAIAQGRDHLLELASQRGAATGALRAALDTDDRRAREDDHPLRLLEQFGVHHEPMEAGVWLLDPEYVTQDVFEDLKAGPRQVTFDRSVAMARDDLLFARDDHPLVQSATEMLLSGETGNAAFLIDDALPPRSVLMEAVFMLECVADRALAVERFLPPLPLRVVIDTRMADRSDYVASDIARQRAPDRQVDLLRYRKVLAKLVPPMLAAAEKLAATRARQDVDEATARAAEWSAGEIARLEALRRVNPAVREEEVAALRREGEALTHALPTARARLDALRLIVSADFLSLRA